MSQAVRSPDKDLLLRIKALESKSDTTYRLPSGPNAVGWGYVPIAAPRGVLGYAEQSSSQTGITTIADLTGLSVAVTVADNRRIRLKGFARITRTVADGQTTFDIREGAADVGYVFAPAQADIPVFVEKTITPTAGSHTYKLSLQRLSGTGTVGTAPDGTSPAWLIVEDIGSA